METNSRTLQNNKISQFILRIDLTPGSNVDFKWLAETLSTDYGQIRTQLHINYNININKVEVNKEEFLTYILGKAPSAILKLNCFEKSIVLTSNLYLNNSIYKERLHKLVTLLSEKYPQAEASRIGMRYINSFPCSKPSEIGKVLNTSEARSIKESLKRDNISRTMLVHEYQNDDFLARIQCGIPNKYYPSKITNYEVVLDIDVYGQGTQPIARWEESVRDYNHGAYSYFTSYIKPTLLEDMK